MNADLHVLSVLYEGAIVGYTLRFVRRTELGWLRYTALCMVDACTFA